MSLQTTILQKLQADNTPGIREVMLLPLAEAARKYYVLFTGDQASYQEKLAQDRAGGYYGYDLNIQIAGKPPVSLEDILRHDYQLLLRDFMGQSMIIGSSAQPLRLRATIENQSSVFYQLRINAEGYVPSQTYQAAWPSDYTDLTQYGQVKIPGLVQITAFFKQQVLSLPVAATEPVIDEKGKAYIFQTSELEAGYSIDISRIDEGVLYESTIEIEWPGLSDLEYFARYRNAELILFTQDFDSEQLIFGTLEQPMRCRGQSSNAGSRGRKLTFFGSAYQMPASFTGSFATAARVETPAYAAGMIDFDDNDFSNKDFL